MKKNIILLMFEMMKKLLYIPAPVFLSGFLFFSSSLLAQNLVPNPSFEQYDTCPVDHGEIPRAIEWHSYGYSPDYFNLCNGGNYGVPFNVTGYQNASTGDAYAAIATHGIGIDDTTAYGDKIREYIGVKLLPTLVPGNNYYVSFKTVFVDQYGDCPHDRLGILFSTKSYSVDSVCPPPCYTTTFLSPPRNFAHVFSTSIISDTANWTLVSGTFTADSAYQYLIIGNHFDTIYNYIDFDTTNLYCQAFYLIDDIYVALDSTSYINDNQSEFSVQVYPNPVKNIFHIKTQDDRQTTIEIYDVFGNKIYQDEITKECSINLSSRLDGVYFLRIIQDDKATVQKIIIVK